LLAPEVQGATDNKRKTRGIETAKPARPPGEMMVEFTATIKGASRGASSRADHPGLAGVVGADFPVGVSGVANVVLPDRAEDGAVASSSEFNPLQLCLNSRAIFPMGSCAIDASKNAGS